MTLAVNLANISSIISVTGSSGNTNINGSLTAASLIGTSLSANSLTGTIPSTVLANSNVYVGTTSITLNRSSAVQVLTGVSISGDASASSSTFALPDTTGTAQWIFVGTWSGAFQGGSKLNIDLTIGQGYNATNNQNAAYKIFFKLSNNSSSQSGSSGNFYADGMSWKYGPSNTISNLRVIQNSSTSYSFYINCGSFTGTNSVYSVSIGQGTWTNSGTLATPSGNYIDLPIYQVLDSNNYNTLALPLTGGTTTGTITAAGSSSALASILTNITEPTTISATAATGTINLYATSQSVLYYTTNASGNFTINISGSVGTTLNTLLSTGQSITVVFLNTNGSTAYYNTSVQVDGSTSGVTTKWQGGTAPSSGNTSAIDVYTYTIIKTGSSTFTVLASLTKFA